MARREEPKKTPDLWSGSWPRIRLALCQVATRPWDVDYNTDACLEALDAAARQGADLALTPECALHGYPYPSSDYHERLGRVAQPLGGAAVEAIRRRATTLGLAVGVGFAEAGPDGRTYNSLAVFDSRGGLALHYRKIHLRDFESIEHEGFFTPGDDFVASRLDVGSVAVEVGGMICFDRELPESVRCLRALGAELVLCPLACDTSDARRPRSFVDNEVITRVRATENEVFIAVVNHADPFNGGSYIVGPGGEILHQMGFGPGVDTVEVPIGVVLERFHAYPLGWMGWGFRRPPSYHVLAGPTTDSSGG